MAHLNSAVTLEREETIKRDLILLKYAEKIVVIFSILTFNVLLMLV